MPERFRNVLLGGYYGQRNVGDDCFGVVGTWGAREYWGAEKIRLLSRMNLCSEVATEAALAGQPAFRGQTRFETCGRILGSTLLVWAGGSIFHSRQSWSTPRGFSLLASRFGIVPAGAIGVSLGPYRTAEDEKGVHADLRKLRFLALRDAASFEEAKTLNLPYAPVYAADLAMLLPVLEPPPSATTDRPILGLALCHYERYAGGSLENERRREEAMLLGLKRFVETGFTGILRFFIFNGHAQYGDYAITSRFMLEIASAGCPIEVVEYAPDPVAIWRKVAECSCFLSTRLHGCIYAAAAEVPCIAVEYHRKCTDFLRDAGIDSKWRVGDMECSGDELATLLAQVSNGRQGAFYPRREELIERAELNFRGPDFFPRQTGEVRQLPSRLGG